VAVISLCRNEIGAEGASALADALKVNTSVTDIGLGDSKIGNEGAAALFDALQVNTSLTSVFFGFDNAIDASKIGCVNALLSRNKRLRSLFLFDARQMLLSRLCGDEFGVLWSYFIASSAGTDDGAAPYDIDAIRRELATVVNERQRRDLCRPALVSDVRNVVTEQTNQIKDQIADQTNQNADQSKQIADQTSQISDLQRSTQILVKQNQQMQEQIQQGQKQMQEQMRQMHALLMTREGVQSADVDEDDKRAVKRRRTDR
jgi:hypothetical protein